MQIIKQMNDYGHHSLNILKWLGRKEWRHVCKKKNSFNSIIQVKPENNEHIIQEKLFYLFPDKVKIGTRWKKKYVGELIGPW